MAKSKEYTYKATPLAKAIRPRPWIKTKSGKKEVCIGYEVTLPNKRVVPKATEAELKQMYERGYCLQYIQKIELDVQDKESTSATDKG